MSSYRCLDISCSHIQHYITEGPAALTITVCVVCVCIAATGERSACGDQWRQYSGDDPQPGCGADPKGRPPHPPGTQERKRLRA